MLTEAWVSFLGNVAGAIIGVGGAFLAAWYGANRMIGQERQRLAAENQKETERKEYQKEKEKQQEEERKLSEYRRACFLAETSLQSHIAQLYSNIRLLHACVSHIQTQGIMANLPRPIVFDMQIMHNFRNIELVNKWLKLSMLCQQINNLTEDFRTYYTRTSEAVHMLQLSAPTGTKLEERINSRVVQADYEVLKGFGSSVIAGTNQLVEETLGMLAIITYHAKLEADYFATVAEMNAYKIPLEGYEKELSELRQHFDPEKMFTDLNQLH